MQTCIDTATATYYITKERIEDLSNFHLDKWCQDAFIENVVEYAGWTAGEIVGNGIGEQVGYSVFEQLGKITMYALPFVGYYTSSAIISKLGVTNKTATRILTGLATLSATTAIVCTNLDPIVEAGAYIGASVASSILAASLGLLGGHAAIKITGSREELFNKDDFINIYAVKSGFTMLVDNLVGAKSQYALANFLVNQLVDTLSYHVFETIKLF